MHHLVIGTAGHIDHGKSALVRALTGVDPDRLREEKDRGITIDLGFAHYQRGDLNIAFVDVPGHERFVRNMLAGASGIDAVMLVIAADESVMPQTREHFDICRLLGVEAGVIALTKSDLVDEETVELVRLETRELVDGSFLQDAPAIAVSARTGEGLDALRTALEGLAKKPDRSVAGPTRLPIDRVFTVKGFGTVVTGTLVSGTLQPDADLEIVPAGISVKARGIQVHGAPQTEASAGQRVAVNLSGVDVADLSRGDTIIDPGGLDTTRRFDATLTVLPGARPVKHGQRVRCHHGTMEAMARVSLSVERARTDPGDAPVFLDALAPGGEGFARIRLEAPIALTRGDRFVLRAYSPAVTIAGGIVLDPTPGTGRLRSRRGVERLEKLSDLSAEADAAAVMVDEAAGRGMTPAALARRLGVGPTGLDGVVSAMVDSGRVVRVGNVLVAPAVLESRRRQLVTLVSEFHASSPLEPGVAREQAREQLSRGAAPAVFDYLVDELVGQGTLVATGHLALSSHRIALSADDQTLKDQIVGLFQQAGLTPPDAAGAVDATGASRDRVDRILKLLSREQTLVKVETLWFHAAALDRLKREVMKLKGSASDPVRLDVPAFKARFGVTRKYAIPLLGYLDQQRVTRRVGNARLVL